MEQLKTKALFLQGDSLVRSWLCEFEYPWEALPHVADFIVKLGVRLQEDS